MKGLTGAQWQALLLRKTRRKILKTVEVKGVFQFRHYTSRNTKRTATEHYALERKAAEQLHKERLLHIISRRPFGHIFDDGCKMSGVNVVVISNNFQHFNLGIGEKAKADSVTFI